MYNFKEKIINDKQIAQKFSTIFIFTGIFTVFFLDKIISFTSIGKNIKQLEPFILGILFVLLGGIVIYILLYYMQKIVKEIEKAYLDLKTKEETRLLPYQFALDKSVDAIHWLDMNGKFIYVNDSTCRLDGYTKKEFENLYLEDIDPNFTRKTAPNCMLEIKNTPNWRIESTHRKKNGTIYPIEVSGHCIIRDGEEIICAFVRDMTRRTDYRNKIINMNKELLKSVDEKEVLLKEIHHRVKNNMEIISSLLNMQARRTNDEKMKYTLMESMSRIQTMALVHEFLYLGKSLAEINFPVYIKRLIEDIKELYITKNTKLNIDLNVNKIYLSTDRCIQVGMVLHEICVNAMKYAFKENRDNLLCIHIKINKHNIITVKVRDNGEGIENLSDFGKSGSIGVQLIHTIVENQLDGTVEFINNNGLECNITFKQKEDWS